MGEQPTRQSRARRGEAVLFVVCLLVVMAGAYGMALVVGRLVGAALEVVHAGG